LVITKEREKLLQAIVYFAQHTKNCSKTKLLKLLFLLDFEHFKLTGRSVTGLDYFALPLGPVPATVLAEFEQPADDFEQSIDVVREPFFNFRRQRVTAKTDFNSSLFSRRELRLLEEIATKYREQTATEMVDVVHAENGVWDRVWNGGSGVGCRIPYELAIEGNPHEKEILEMQQDYQVILKTSRKHKAA
jgi:uncharacterized phage-associated protein